MRMRKNWREWIQVRTALKQRGIFRAVRPTESSAHPMLYNNNDNNNNK